MSQTYIYSTYYTVAARTIRAVTVVMGTLVAIDTPITSPAAVGAGYTPGMSEDYETRISIIMKKNHQNGFYNVLQNGFYNGIKWLTMKKKQN